MNCSWLVLRPGLFGLITSGGGGFTSCGGWGSVSVDMVVTAGSSQQTYAGWFLFSPVGSIRSSKADEWTSAYFTHCFHDRQLEELTHGWSEVTPITRDTKQNKKY